MDAQAFKDMKPGTKVTLVVDLVSGLGNPNFPESGTTLHRFSSWMDDGITNCFQFDIEGGSDYAFFSHDEVEVIDEQA